MAYTVTLKTQNRNGGIKHDYETINEAIEGFKFLLTGVYEKSGGYVSLVENLDNSREDMLVIWTEHCEGGYVIGGDGRGWEIEGLDCDDKKCENGGADEGGYCVTCNRKALDIILYNLAD